MSKFSTLAATLVSQLRGDKIVIKDRDNLLKKLETLIKDGPEKLQCISDYDLTITKHYSKDGVDTKSSFGMMTLCNSLQGDFAEKKNKMKEKYFPIEMNAKLPLSEKTTHMIEWYDESDKLFTGVKLPLDELQQAVESALPELRDQSIEMFRLLRDYKVPVLVLSAGLGDVIRMSLKCHGLDENETFHIVSNFLKTNGDILNGFGCKENGKFIHPFNKNGLGCGDYLKTHSLKSNVILMGDSLGDANMDAGVPQVECVLKIGFLHGSETHIKDSLSNYQSSFDIVLVDDQTMDVPMKIFKMILTR